MCLFMLMWCNGVLPLNDLLETIITDILLVHTVEEWVLNCVLSPQNTHCGGLQTYGGGVP